MEVAPRAASEDAGLCPPALPAPRSSPPLPLLWALFAAPAARGHQGASDIRPRGSAERAGSSESGFQRLPRHQPCPCCGGGYSHPCPLRLGPGRAAAPLSRPPRATWCPPHLEHLSRAMPPLPPHGRLLASRQDLPLLENCPLAPVPEPERPQKKDERTPPRSPLPLLSLGRKKSRRGPRSVEGTSAHAPPPTPS